MVLFLAGVGFLLYIVAVYPLLLTVLARWKPKPIHKTFRDTTVTILLAVFNGESWIRAKLESILRLDYPRDLLQILVISDGSTDQTDSIAAEFQRYGVELLRVPHAGKAAALNAGMTQATSEVLFFTDVRQRLERDSLKRLVECLGGPEVGGASGQIQLVKSEGGGEAEVGLYWRFEKWLRDQLTTAGSLLVATGCIYAVRRELARPLPVEALIDDAYLPLAVIFAGRRFVFERQAIAYDYPTQLDVEFQRKVRTLAGLFQVVRSYPRLLNLFTPVGFHFFSYKLGRLLLPYALLLVAGSSIWLPRPWAGIAIGAQLLLYGLAAVDHWLPSQSALKRLSAVCRTFVVFAAAGLWAVSVLFVPARRLWKETRVKTDVQSGHAG